MDQGIVIDQATDFSQIDADISLSFLPIFVCELSVPTFARWPNLCRRIGAPETICSQQIRKINLVVS
jgi:hypothetical protein